MQYRVAAISEEIAQEVRATLRSPKYGHPAHVEIANGYGPCRSCLQVFAEGQDERILFTYDAFTGVENIPAPGPVFIHRAECKRFEAAGFPPQMRNLPLLFEVYGRSRQYLSRETVADNEIDTAIDRLLTNSAVAYIQVRNSEAGCFMARIERAAAV